MTRLPAFLNRQTLLTFLSLSLWGSAQAFTLSSPQILSKQGEPLRIELDVIEMSVEEQLDFSAKLASSDIYKTAQIELPMSTDGPLRAQVNLLHRNNGKLFIQITSREPVTSDFLDLMVDFRWSTGRSLRDIAVALNDTRNNNKSAKNLPAISPEPASERPPMAHEAPSAPNAVVAEHPKPPTPPSTTEKTAKVNAESAHSIRVKKGDTAGSIASQNLPEGVSLDQMLVALLRNNPEAFVDSNVNRLKSGAVLNLPSTSQAQQIDARQARKEISVQSKNFNAYRAELAEHAATGHIPKATRDSEGKLEAALQKPQASPDKDTLKLTKPQSPAATENKVAQALQAKEVASRAAEISRNIEELGKIAAATAASDAHASGSLQATVAASEPASDATQDASDSHWIDDLSNNPQTGIIAGILVFLAALGLWLKKRQARQGDNIEGLPPLNVKLDMDMTPSTAKAPLEQPHFEASAEAPTEQTAAESIPRPQQPSPPIRHLPDISLDLNDGNTSSDPFQVRIDLANELWQLGQQHTSRALMEEVEQEASGDIKNYAQQWLAERG